MRSQRNKTPGEPLPGLAQSAEEGFALLQSMIFSGIAGLILLGVTHILDLRINWMQILRTEQRMQMLHQRLQNACKSYSTMIQSASLNPGTNLQRCFSGQGCTHDATPVPLNLVDGLNRRLTGRFDLQGRACTKACPLDIATSVAIHCANSQSTCLTPSEVVTDFKIQKTSEAKTLRDFVPIQDTATLAMFSCPAGQYIRALTDDGQFQCSAPEASPNGDACGPKFAAFGMDAKGFLLCRPVINYCGRPIGLAAALDTSGSMSSRNKIGEAKQALSTLVGKMDKQRDQGSYTKFASTATVRAPLSKNFDMMQQSIQGETAGGNTNISAALTAAADSLKTYSSGEKIIILVSDGFHNTGNSDPNTVATDLKSQGFRIISVGFSQAADKLTLRRIASPGDFFFANDGNELQKALSQITQMTCR